MLRAAAVTRAVLSLACVACNSTGGAPAGGDYLFVWARDSAGTASDFLAVIDATAGSAGYGTIVNSIATGGAPSHPHHTEDMLAPNGHLLANGFRAGQTWLFDLTQPHEPRILTSFGDRAGFSHPHTYTRLANGNVLATFQYRADSAPAMASHAHGAGGSGSASGSGSGPGHVTGGLVEMDERGRVIRSASARDTAIADQQLFPYSALPVAALDRVVSTTTDMDEGNTRATSQWVQLWRWSDLKLLRSIALPAGPRGDEHHFTGEPRLLPDGRSVYIHTFNCGLYLLRDVDGDQPRATLVTAFQGKNCGVPVLAGRYWLQPVPAAHAVIALDITDPERPRQVSSVALGDDVEPHWLAIDRAGRRLVVNSSSAGSGNRLFVVDLDPATGALALDGRFRDAGSPRPGVSMRGKTWPHGFTGTAIPHGTVFSR